MPLDTYAAMEAVEAWLERKNCELPSDYRIFPCLLGERRGARTLHVHLPVRLPSQEVRYLYLARFSMHEGDRSVRLGENRMTRSLQELHELGECEPIHEVNYWSDPLVGSTERSYGAHRKPLTLWDAYERVTGALVDLRIRLEFELEARDEHDFASMRDYKSWHGGVEHSLAKAHEETQYLRAWIHEFAERAKMRDPITGDATQDSPALSPRAYVAGNGHCP